MTTLRVDIQKSPFYKKFRLIVDEVSDSVDLEKIQSEAKQLHAGRKARSLYGNKLYSPKHLIDASMIELSYRARLVEIRANLGIQVSILDKAVEAVRKFITAEYSDDLNDLFKTEHQRKAFLDRVINKAIAVKSDIDATVSMLDFLIKDIDQASFQLRTVMESLKLLDSSKGKIV